MKKEIILFLIKNQDKKIKFKYQKMENPILLQKMDKL